METWSRFFSGLVAAVAGFFAPISPLILSTVVFIGVDFLTGIAADRKEALAEQRTWYFESRKAWRTVLKLTMALTCIVLGWMMEHYILDFVTWRLARLFTGFICGVELWSFLENAAVLSDAPVFVALRRVARRQLRGKLRGEK